MTTHELDQLAAAREFAKCMLGIVFAIDHCERLMARLGVGRVGA
jgi:hypothetical protein